MEKRVLVNLQLLEEKRINSFKESLIESISNETDVIPVIEKCYNGMNDAANKISCENDIEVVVQLFKTGYKIPDDHVFEDLSEPNGNTNSSSNLSNESSSNLSSNGTIKTISSLATINGNGKTRDKKYGTLNPLKKIGIFKTKNEIESLYDLAPQQQKKELQKKIDALKADILKEQNLA